MRIVTMTYSAAADGRLLSIDHDTILSSVAGPGGTLISTDPAATVSAISSAPTDQLLNSVIATLPTASQISTDFPLSAGERIFVSSSSKGAIQLFFIDA